MLLQVYKAVADEVGADKVGIRFSPFYVMVSPFRMPSDASAAAVCCAWGVRCSMGEGHHQPANCVLQSKCVCGSSAPTRCHAVCWHRLTALCWQPQEWFTSLGPA